MNVGSQSDEAEILERPPGELAGSTTGSSTILDETAMKLEIRGTPSARLVEILRASEERVRAWRAHHRASLIAQRAVETGGQEKQP